MFNKTRIICALLAVLMTINFSLFFYRKNTYAFVDGGVIEVTVGYTIIAALLAAAGYEVADNSDVIADFFAWCLDCSDGRKLVATTEEEYNDMVMSGSEMVMVKRETFALLCTLFQQFVASDAATDQKYFTELTANLPVYNCKMKFTVTTYSDDLGDAEIWFSDLTPVGDADDFVYYTVASSSASHLTYIISKSPFTVTANLTIDYASNKYIKDLNYSYVCSPSVRYANGIYCNSGGYSSGAFYGVTGYYCAVIGLGTQSTTDVLYPSTGYNLYLTSYDHARDTLPDGEITYIVSALEGAAGSTVGSDEKAYTVADGATVADVNVVANTATDVVDKVYGKEGSDDAKGEVGFPVDGTVVGNPDITDGADAGAVEDGLTGFWGNLSNALQNLLNGLLSPFKTVIEYLKKIWAWLVGFLALFQILSNYLTNDTTSDDTSDSSDSTDDSDNSTVKNYLLDGLKSKFPFCIPFDFISFITVLSADPITPKFDWTFTVPQLNLSVPLEIDLSPYDDVAKNIRRFQLIIFCIGLVLITRNIIKG